MQDNGKQRGNACEKLASSAKPCWPPQYVYTAVIGFHTMLKYSHNDKPSRVYVHPPALQMSTKSTAQ